MRVKLNTRVELKPKYDSRHTYVTVGATPSFTFDLYDKVYTFEDIYQVTFSFKQDDKLYFYTMINHANEQSILDNHFAHMVGEGYDYIEMTMTSEETLQFIPTEDIHTFVNFEVAIELLNHSVIIEKQPCLHMIDSLYREIIEEA